MYSEFNDDDSNKINRNNRCYSNIDVNDDNRYKMVMLIAIITTMVQIVISIVKLSDITTGMYKNCITLTLISFSVFF